MLTTAVRGPKLLVQPAVFEHIVPSSSTPNAAAVDGTVPRNVTPGPGYRLQRRLCHAAFTSTNGLTWSSVHRPQMRSTIEWERTRYQHDFTGRLWR